MDDLDVAPKSSRVKHPGATEIYYPERVLIVGWEKSKDALSAIGTLSRALRVAGLVPLVLPTIARARTGAETWRQQRTRVCIVRDGVDGLEPDVACREIRLAAPWLDLIVATDRATLHPAERIAAHINGCLGFSPIDPVVLAAQAAAVVSRHAVIRAARGEGE